jgi:hypothetical protein
MKVAEKSTTAEHENSSDMEGPASTQEVLPRTD